MGDVITDHAKYKRGWTGGLPETPCGWGSKKKNTELQREWIPKIVERYNIQTVADIGAGDLNWLQHMEWSVEYQGYDLVPRHEDIVEFNILEEVPPKVDMLMCFWVLNHMPMDECRAALENLKASGSHYLMMTDRPIWRAEQPAEINMPYIEKIILNRKEDSILLIDLSECS